MDITMNAPSTTVLAISGAAALVLADVLSTLSLSREAGLLSAVVTVAALALVAFAAQSRRLRDEQRLVYRPVYVDRQSVQRRVTSSDE